jgi:hypothetical protein
MGTFQPPPSQQPPLEDGNELQRFSEAWSGWFSAVADALSGGYTGTIPLAKLTGGGTDGSLTYRNGRLTGAVAPT